MLKLAYLLNSYPRTSTTFIRREIEALERAGQSVLRFAARQWNEPLVDPLDRAELEKTHYLLTNNSIQLAATFLSSLIFRPVLFLKAFWATLKLWRAARSGFVRHIAYFLQACYFRTIAEKEGIDHVHVHFATNATAIAMLSQMLGGPAYSFTVHGPDELVEPNLLSIAEKIAKAKFVVAITEFCRSQLIWHGGCIYADKIHVMRCGIDLSEFVPATATDPANQTLVCLGRLCPQKGQALLPAVVARLKKDFPDLKIILIGDGESRHDVEVAIEKHQLQEQFEVRGWMENVHARSIVAEARGLLLPSFAEGLPIVIMEAMALGKPVVSTYIAGIPELLDERCGWIVPAGDEDALEKAIRDCLGATHERLAALGKEGRIRVERRHNIDVLASQLIKKFAAAG